MADYPDDVIEAMRLAMSQDDLQPTAEEVRRGLAAADTAMLAHKQKSCTHGRATGTGSVSSSGASSMDYYCPDCSKRWHQDLPARTMYDAAPEVKP